MSEDNDDTDRSPLMRGQTVTHHPYQKQAVNSIANREVSQRALGFGTEPETPGKMCHRDNDYRPIMAEIYDEWIADDEVRCGDEDGADWHIFHNESLIALQREMETGLCGPGKAVFAALNLCFASRIAPPRWVRDELHRLYALSSTAEAKSWDELLGPPVPKGKSLNALRKRIRLAPELYSNVADLRLLDPHRPVDGTLFEEAGEPLGLGKTLAQDYYYWYIRQPENQPLHEILTEDIEEKKAQQADTSHNR